MSCFSRSLSWRKELAHKSEMNENPALQSEMAPEKTTKKGQFGPFLLQDCRLIPGIVF